MRDFLSTEKSVKCNGTYLSHKEKIMPVRRATLEEIKAEEAKGVLIFVGHKQFTNKSCDRANALLEKKEYNCYSKK